MKRSKLLDMEDSTLNINQLANKYSTSYSMCLSCRKNVPNEKLAANLRHICSACAGKVDSLPYDYRLLAKSKCRGELSWVIL